MKVGYQIKIKVHNRNDKQKKIMLLNAIFTLHKPSCGLPDGVSVEVDVIKRKQVSLPYSNFVKRIAYIDQLNQSFDLPMMVRFSSTTNNRQLDIGVNDNNGCFNPAQPSLTIDKEPRPEKDVEYSDGDDYWVESEYVTEWNPKVWNIADTGEWFIVGGMERVDLTLLPNQEFELVFDIAKKTQPKYIKNLKIKVNNLCAKK